MTKLIDHTFNYLRFALLGVASAVIILGPAAYAQNQAQIDMPSASYHDSTGFAKYSCYLNSTTMSDGGGTGFWDCVAHNTATCGFWKGIACSLAGVAAQAAFLGTGWGAAVALAKAAGTRAGKWVVRKIINLVQKIPDFRFTFSYTNKAGELVTKTLTIPFSKFATWASEVCTS